jgi:hypothetical protein
MTQFELDAKNAREEDMKMMLEVRELAARNTVARAIRAFRISDDGAEVPENRRLIPYLRATYLAEPPKTGKGHNIAMILTHQLSKNRQENFGEWSFDLSFNKKWARCIEIVLEEWAVAADVLHNSQMDDPHDMPITVDFEKGQSGNVPLSSSDSVPMRSRRPGGSSAAAAAAAFSDLRSRRRSAAAESVWRSNAAISDMRSRRPGGSVPPM